MNPHREYGFLYNTSDPAQTARIIAHISGFNSLRECGFFLFYMQFAEILTEKSLQVLLLI